MRFGKLIDRHIYRLHFETQTGRQFDQYVGADSLDDAVDLAKRLLMQYPNTHRIISVAGVLEYTEEVFYDGEDLEGSDRQRVQVPS